MPPRRRAVLARRRAGSGELLSLHPSPARAPQPFHVEASSYAPSPPRGKSFHKVSVFTSPVHFVCATRALDKSNLRPRADAPAKLAPKAHQATRVDVLVARGSFGLGAAGNSNARGAAERELRVLYSVASVAGGMSRGTDGYKQAPGDGVSFSEQ